MEQYKSRGAAARVSKKLLLPISLGPSSTALLWILDNYIQGQRQRMGRSSYELVVVHVDVEGKNTAVSDLLRNVKSRFHDHSYVASKLEDALAIGIDWEALGLQRSPGDDAEPADVQLQKLLESVSSVTSRADIVSTLLTRLLVHHAKASGCESILFGDSTTRLAEKTLTETAKGRGFSLPWQVSDGMSPYGVTFQYPMRDLLRKEILTLSQLSSVPIQDLISDPSPLHDVSVSSKSTTIDQLMTQYFESVEENFPSIVANVVRTSAKLKAPGVSDTSLPCGLCRLPVSAGTDGIHGWSGDQTLYTRHRQQDTTDQVLCYGCTRSITS
jgi:cytoplasmic tRNA 2-thiolation protein 2